MPAPERPIELREFPEPELEPASALLRTVCSEVCGTDVHLWHGRLSGVPYPIIPGHVSAGHIDRLRGRFPSFDGGDLREGDRAVFFDVHRTCGECRACTIDRTPTRCPQRRVYGITDSADEGLYGGWSQAVYLEPGVHAMKLPDRVTFEDYIGGGCGLITAVHITERAEIQEGATVLVQGVGAVGLSAIALAKLAGAAQVVAVGAPDDRLALARAMGADEAIDLNGTTQEQRRERIHDITGGRGVDVAIEAAGSARAVEEGLDLVRDGGAYVIAGHYTDAGPSTINVHRQINRKHLDVRGCWGSEPRHFLQALQVLDAFSRRFPWKSIAARSYELLEMNEALAAAETLAVPKAIVRVSQPASADSR